MCYRCARDNVSWLVACCARPTVAVRNTPMYHQILRSTPVLTHVSALSEPPEATYQPCGLFPVWFCLDRQNILVRRCSLLVMAQNHHWHACWLESELAGTKANWPESDPRFPECVCCGLCRERLHVLNDPGLARVRAWLPPPLPGWDSCRK